jgi:hypothetical protein
MIGAIGVWLESYEVGNVTNPGTTLCSAMVAYSVLVCSCASCGQTLLMLQCAQAAGM